MLPRDGRNLFERLHAGRVADGRFMRSQLGQDTPRQGRGA